ncbi:MAG: N-acetylmannosamine-6-phosphate 2-epimerase [Candidatus Meridianibacter frigidus]|nr:MAG: N-acetylmannosamine-6-phosphate 2-epimerase [Candidatus Eremiobacteraeota bacterium]
MTGILDRLRGGLIVSCQARAGSALDDPAVIAAFARAAQDNGAVAVRVQGVENIRAVRARVEVPVIGLVKRSYDGYEPYITPSVREVEEVCGAGAQVVAFDATARLRPGGATLAQVHAAARGAGALSMADCARLQDAQTARELGIPVVATTLCGYTKDTANARLPALELVEAMRGLGFVICEGGVHRPADARAAREHGADAVVVGTAITNADWLVEQFVAALR